MFVSHRPLVVAAAAALLVAVSRETGLAEISVSASAPIRADIDASCHAATATAHMPTTPSGSLRVVFLERLGSSPSAYGPWKVTTAAAHTKLLEGPSIGADNFVTAVVSGTSLAFASESFADESGDGGTVNEYCFKSGKLARAMTKIVDLSVDASYTRRYYFDETGALIADSGIVVKPLTPQAKAAQLPSSAIPLPVHKTAASQPYYATLQKALAASK